MDGWMDGWMNTSIKNNNIRNRYFVDFEKVFDSLWWIWLLYKIYKVDIDKYRFI
jgi:hypothetical protein